jgi:hypothetical protein
VRAAQPESLDVGELPFCITIAALTFQWARRSSVGFVVLEAGDDDDDAACAIAQLRAHLDVDHQIAVGLPMRIIDAVVSMFRTILVAVPALSRVDPAITSGRLRGDRQIDEV